MTNPKNILAGSYDSVMGSSGTLITIPAGRIWKGRIVLNAVGSVGVSGAAVASRATVQTSSAGTPYPASGTVLAEVFISLQAQTASTTDSMSGFSTVDVVLAADAANDLLVTATKNSVTSFAATAFGELIV